MSDEQKKEAQKPSRPALPLWIFMGLVFILGLVSLGFSYYTLQTLYTEKTRLAQKTEEILQEQAQIKINNQQLENKLETSKTTVLPPPIQENNEDWIFEKARFYLELAQINAHWTKDYSTSVALLEQADALLKQSNASKLLSVRQSIAQEITALTAAAQLDVPGLLSQLDAAAMAVHQLNTHTTLDKPESPKNKGNDWRSELKNSLNQLEKLVIIRRDDEEIKPLLSPIFRSLIKESLLLQLQEAQWAVIHNNHQVYQLVLQEAIQSVQRHFETEENSTKALLAQLTNLKKIEWSNTKPEFGSSLQLLNQVIHKKGAK